MREKALVAATLAIALSGAAPEPVRLQPTSVWDVDYAENSCRLIRTFGEGKDKTKLVIESASPESMNALIVGKPLRTNAARVTARFLPNGAEATNGSVAESTNTGDPALVWPNGIPLWTNEVADQRKQEAELVKRRAGVRPPAASLEKEKAEREQRQLFATTVTELEIDTSRHRPVFLETGSLAEALAAFDKCGRDSLKDWGLDPEIQEKIVRPPWFRSRTFILSAEDYPTEMLRQGKESQVTARLIVNANGRVTKCTPLSYFQEELFKQVVCDKIIEKAVFEPAELADGTKVPSYVTQVVIFRMR